MALCILPDWVRCASSTNTNRLPLAWKSFGIVALSSLMKSSLALSRADSSVELRNLCTSEQISHSVDVFSVPRGQCHCWCDRSAH